MLVTAAELKSVLGVGSLYPDEVLDEVILAAETTITAYLVDLTALETAPVKEAVLAVAVDMWQNRQAPGGQLSGVDFQPAPYRLGRSLLAKVAGLLGPYLNVEGMVG